MFCNCQTSRVRLFLQLPGFLSVRFWQLLPQVRKFWAPLARDFAPPFVVWVLWGWFRLDENLKHLRTLATAVLKMLFTMSYVSLILDVKLPGRQESSVSRRSSAGVLVESEWYVMDAFLGPERDDIKICVCMCQMKHPVGDWNWLTVLTKECNRTSPKKGRNALPMSGDISLS